jgi:hypothetical protein
VVLAAGTAVAGVIVLIILIVVVALVVRFWRYSLFKFSVNTACLHNDTIKARTIKSVCSNIYAGSDNAVKRKMQDYH